MKVVVAFGDKRVVVPCGDGSLTVRDLIANAVRRYRNATGLSESEVEVRAIESADGALFDMDDLVGEVAEDRDLLVAVFEEKVCRIGDGASESASHSEVLSSNGGSDGIYPSGRTDRATSEDRLAAAVYDLPPVDSNNHSEADLLRSSSPSQSPLRGHSPSQSQSRPLSMGSGGKGGMLAAPENGRNSPQIEQAAANQAFRRNFADNSPRQTAKPSSELVDRWFSNQNMRACSIEGGSSHYGSPPPGMPPTLLPRQDPLGSSYDREGAYAAAAAAAAQRQRSYSNRSLSLPPRVVNVPNDGLPLGIQVVAHYEKPPKPTGSSVPIGLLVRHVDEGGKAERMGLLTPGDLITDINNTNLQGLSFDRAQDVFKSALKAQTLTLKTITTSGGSDLSSASPHPVTPSDHQTQSNQQFFPHSPHYNGLFASTSHLAPGSSSTLPSRGQQRLLANPQPSTPPPFEGNLKASPLVDSPLSLMGRANTKKIGRKIRIQLTKDAEGLGLTLATRDNATVVGSGPAPICIKKILPNGAAIRDGRLVEGDRLLEVNGIQVTGMTQKEVVQILKGIAVGEIADILISRQEKEDSMPRQMPEETSDVTDSALREEAAQNKRSVHQFTIRLNDTGISAGLGISVKGHTIRDPTTGECRDYGVFIKHLMNGGAAWKDGRLRINDRLLEINGESLTNKSNKQAIDFLRNSVTQHSKHNIDEFHVTVARYEGREDNDTSSSASTVRLTPQPTAGSSLVRPEEGNITCSSPDEPDGVANMDSSTFSRDDLSRRSLSEKRTGGSTRDANQSQFYRDNIKPRKEASTLPRGATLSSVRRSGSANDLLDPSRDPGLTSRDPGLTSRDPGLTSRDPGPPVEVRAVIQGLQTYTATRADVGSIALPKAASLESLTNLDTQTSPYKRHQRIYPDVPPPVPSRSSHVPEMSRAQRRDDDVITTEMSRVRRRDDDVITIEQRLPEKQRNDQLNGSNSSSGSGKKKNGGILRGLFKGSKSKSSPSPAEDRSRNVGRRSAGSATQPRPQSALPYPVNRQPPPPPPNQGAPYKSSGSPGGVQGQARGYPQPQSLQRHPAMSPSPGQTNVNGREKSQDSQSWSSSSLPNHRNSAISTSFDALSSSPISNKSSDKYDDHGYLKTSQINRHTNVDSSRPNPDTYNAVGKFTSDQATYGMYQPAGRERVVGSRGTNQVRNDLHATYGAIRRTPLGVGGSYYQSIDTRSDTSSNDHSSNMHQSSSALNGTYGTTQQSNTDSGYYSTNSPRNQIYERRSRSPIPCASVSPAAVKPSSLSPSLV